MLRGRAQEDLPVAYEDSVRDYLQELKLYVFVRPDGLYPRAVRELASVLAMLLSIIFENFWRLEEIPENCRKVGVAPVLQKRPTDSLGGL